METAEASDGIPKATPPPSAGIPPENPLRGNRTERNGEGTDKERKERTTEALPLSPPSAPPPPPQSAADAAPKPTRGTRLAKQAEAWSLPKAWGEWALEKYPVWTREKVLLEAGKFANHWCSKTRDATKLDWLATWQNWCMNEIAHRDDPKPNGHHPATVDIAARNAEAKRLLGFSPTENVDA
jgi:hypothetical protein